MTIETTDGLRPDHACGQGWLDETQASGRWLYGAERYFGPDCTLAREARVGFEAVDAIIRENTGGAAGPFFQMLIDSCVDYAQEPEAFVFFPKNLPLLSHAIKVRPDIRLYGCMPYRARGEEDAAGVVPGLGVILVFDSNGVLAMEPDGGLVSSVQAVLRGVAFGLQWICLAAAPSAAWTTEHASYDYQEFSANLDESITEGDWNWAHSSPGGAVLRELALHHFRAERRWLYASAESFSWWPGRLRIDVVVHSRFPDREAKGPYVSATIVLAEGVRVDDGASAVAELQRRGSGCYAVCWDRETGMVSFSIAARIRARWDSGGVAAFAARALIMAADAHDLLEEACRLFRAEPFDSALYRTRRRTEPDPSLRFRDAVCLPTSRERIPWMAAYEIMKASAYLEKSGFVLELSGDGADFIARGVDFPGFEISATRVEESPAGSGLELLAATRVRGEPGAVYWLAASLNRDLVQGGHDLQVSGTWVGQPEAARSRLAYRSFLPSALCYRGALSDEIRALRDWLSYWQAFYPELVSGEAPAP